MLTSSFWSCDWCDFLLKSKDVLYQVASDLGEVKCFYSSFSDAGQKPPVFQKFKKACLPVIGIKICWWYIQLSQKECYLHFVRKLSNSAHNIDFIIKTNLKKLQDTEIIDNINAMEKKV